MKAQLRVVQGSAVLRDPVTADPWEFQADCVDALVASLRARGFSPVTVEDDIGLLERTLTAPGRPAWDVTPEDIDRVVGDLALAGRTASTRREHAQTSRGSVRKTHVRFGKCARISGPRPRWVPMLDGLDLVLHRFPDDVREEFPDSPVRFADDSGGSAHRGTIRNCLRYLMGLEDRPAAGRFSPHAPWRACATHNYERDVICWRTPKPR
ncbi:hypothetical protein ACFWWM_16690 [Streptomyces sp. NPDC058682]|uniref:hypothetical protein n=1 Tax=Streptomyces sp. NPDC058682 TaxID=3346596 RepID=UPI00366611A7